MLASIEVKDKTRGNIFLHFGDIEALDPPNIINREFHVSDFQNPMDLFRLNKVMEDEGFVDSQVWNAGVKFYSSIQELHSVPSYDFEVSRFKSYG